MDPSTKKYVEPEKLRSKQRFYWTIRHNDFGGASCFFSHIMFLFTVSVAPSHIIQIKMASYLRGPSTRRSWLPWGVRDQIMQSNQKGKHMESTESRLDTKFHDLFPSIYNIYIYTYPTKHFVYSRGCMFHQLFLKKYSKRLYWG